MRRRIKQIPSEIEASRNLGPKSAAWLASVGIHTRADLACIGAIEACRRVRRAGHPVSVVMAYAIEAMLMDCDWRALPFEFCKQLQLEFENKRREESRP